MPANARRAIEHIRAHSGVAVPLTPGEATQFPVPRRVPGGVRADAKAVAARWALTRAAADARAEVADPVSIERAAELGVFIENYIGTVKIPVGLAGPLRVSGLHARGDFYIPLATTEAALVASHARGAALITEAGGCCAMVLSEGVCRAPGFRFRDAAEAAGFLAWAAGETERFKTMAAGTTRYGALVDVRLALEGNHAVLVLDYTTGDASGQNMVTLATEAVCADILARTPIKPAAWYIESNMSGDKKASLQSFMHVRGRKVTADVTVPAALVRTRLRTTSAAMADYWRMSALGGVMSGTLGVHGHYANSLAAVYLACGQDVACVAESSVGVTRMELTDSGDLYAAVTLPNIMVGTVGGGTSLPTARACLESMGLFGEGKARAFAEVCAALALAGELSIVGALAAGEFAQAHRKLARMRKKKG